MSYLEVPHIHFGGLFFTAPDTINNYIGSYNEKVPLTNAQGEYRTDGPGGGPTGWNPLGVAQTWLEECKVLGVVDRSGNFLTSGDPVIGAPVESASPKTQQSNGSGGLYDFAKLVDLDPQQQGRSAVYGCRLFLKLPGGGGFSGPLSVPLLQFMGPHIPPPPGSSWTAVGTWMGEIVPKPDGTGLIWGDVSSSPFLTSFKAACSLGVAVKITMDLHQNNPQTKFTTGDMFCYGRVLVTMGPVKAGELAQVVPGRLLQQAPSTAVPPAAIARSANTGDEVPVSRGSREAVVAEGERIAKAVSSAASANLATRSASAPPTIHPWNPGFAVVQSVEAQPGVKKTLLNVDLGGSIWLAVQSGQSPKANGLYEVDDNIELGWIDSTDTFNPFTNGNVGFSDQYVQLASTQKSVYLVQGSCLFTIELVGNEPSEVANTQNRLAVRASGNLMLEESAGDVYMNVSQFSTRLEPKGFPADSSQVKLMVRQAGLPVPNITPPVQVQVTSASGQPSTDISVVPDTSVNGGKTDEYGIATYKVSAMVTDFDLSPVRKPLDSQVYYVDFIDPNGNSIGDGASNANLTVLLWKPYQAPPNPTWETDVAPILQAYARLYPGMTARLDIGDEATVKGFAQAMYGRMSSDFDAPGYMPVTRDLMPTKTQMILNWLRPFLADS